MLRIVALCLHALPACSVLEQLGGKTMVMTLLGHEDPNVRYEALLAVQKLMVHNWQVTFKVITARFIPQPFPVCYREYLGRQLEKEQGEKGTHLPIRAS